MDKNMKTGRDGSTAGSDGNSYSFEALLATASGTSTHNVGDGSSHSNTVSGGDSGFIPIYSNLDHAQLPSTLGNYGNCSRQWNASYDGYDESQESQINFDQNGMYAQASNSRTYQTPRGLSRSSVGMRMRFGLGGLSIETSMRSMIPGGDGRMLMLSSSGGSMIPPFPSFGLMSGRFIPSSLPSSPFRGMMSSHMSSTHLFDQSPFSNMQTPDAMYRYPTISSTDNENYNGPIITEIYDDDGDVVVDGDVDDAIQGKKKADGIGTTVTQTHGAMYGYPRQSSSDSEDYNGPIITEVYDDDDDDVDDDVDGDIDDDVDGDVDDDVAQKKVGNEENTDTQPGNDQASLDALLTVTDDVAHDTFKHNANIKQQNCEDSKDFDTNGRKLNASEFADITGNRRDFEHTGMDRVEYTDYNVTPSVQTKEKDSGESTGTCLQPLRENLHTVVDTMSDPKQSVHANTGNKQDNRRKRSFRTQSFVHTPLPFEDMLVGSNESNQDIPESPISLPSLEIDNDKFNEMNEHIVEDKESMGKIDVATLPTNLSPRDVGNTDMINEMLSNSKNAENSRYESDNELCVGTSSLDADVQIRDKDEADMTNSRVSDCNVDDSYGREHEINDFLKAGRKSSHLEMSKSDVLTEEHTFQKVDDAGLQIREYSEFRSSSNEDQLQSLPSLENGQNIDNVHDITTPLHDQSNDDRQWQYPGQLLQQGKRPTTVLSSGVSVSRTAGENELEHDVDAVHYPLKKEQPHQQQQQQQQQWQQTWPWQQQREQQQLQQYQQQLQEQQWQQSWQQQHQQKQQQQKHHKWPNHQHDEQHQYKQQLYIHCSGHAVENGSHILSNSKQSPENIGQQKCKHNHVYMYHTNMNKEAYMCLDCGKERHIVNCLCSVQVHQTHEDKQFRTHENEHVEPPAKGFDNNNATPTSTRRIRNKNATVIVNKSSVENSEQTSLPQSTTKDVLGTGNNSQRSTTKTELDAGHNTPQSTTKNELDAGHNTPQSTSKNELDAGHNSPQSTTMNEGGTETHVDDRRYEYPANRSDGLSVLIASVGLQMKDVIPDGNCLFTAITDQLRIRGDFSFTARSLRYAAVEYLRNNPNQDDDTPLFKFLDEQHEGSWDEYLNKMSRDGHWGDHIVICALAHVLNRRIIIYHDNEELASTIVKPRGNVTLNENESTTASLVDATAEVDKNSEDAILDEMYLGHVSQSHYVSLRPLDWKDKLMQELKNKSTSCLIGINPESRKIGKDETKNCGVPCEHFTFATKYIQMSDIIITGKKTYLQSENKMFTSEIYHPISDIMNALIIDSEKRSINNEKTTCTEIPNDTFVVNSRDGANCKDLVCDNNDCLPGYTKLMPVEHWRWPKVLDKGHYLTHLKPVGINESSNDYKRSASRRMLAFRCEWPKGAQEWIERPRKYGWPPEDVKDDIEHHCCLVIPQSQSSSDDVTEWKYTFHKAEYILAEKALSIPQLECFHIIKLMLENIQRDSKLNFRALKQVFFYTCEELGDQLWHCDTLACIHMFLDRLLINLRHRVIKGYFFEQENFLDDELNGDALDKCISDLEVLKNHTFPLLYFTFDAYVQLNTSLNMLFDRLIEDVLYNATSTDYNATVHSCFLPLVTEGVSTLWHSKHYCDAFNRSMRAVHQINSIRQTTYQLSQQDVILCVLNSLGSSLNKWLYAFYADLRLGTSYVDTVSDHQSPVSLRDVYGPTLADYVHQKHGSLTVPFELVQVANLGQTSVAFLGVLEQLQMPMDIYGSVIYQCTSHTELILKSFSSIDVGDHKLVLKDVTELVYKIRIHCLQEKIASNELVMAKNLLAIAHIHKENGNLKQFEAMVDEAKTILERSDKKP